jgi:hypothetical protein
MNRNIIIKLSVFVFSFILLFGVGKVAKAADCDALYSTYESCYAQYDDPDINCANEYNAYEQCVNEAPQTCNTGLEASDGTCYNDIASYCAAVNNPQRCPTCSSGLENNGTCYNDLTSYCDAVEDPAKCASGGNGGAAGNATYDYCVTTGGGDCQSCFSLPGSPYTSAAACPTEANGYSTYDNCISGGGSYDMCKGYPGAPTNAMDANCVSEHGNGWAYDGKKCVGKLNAACTDSNECANGCKCDTTYGTCQTSFLGSIPGTGGCSAAPTNPGTAGGGAGSGGKTPVGTTGSKPTTITIDGKPYTLPANTIIYADGSTSSGLPAGSIAGAADAGSDSASGFMMCANGIMAPVCASGVGGTPLSPYAGGGGLPFDTGYVGGMAGPKCGVSGQFAEVGGVCFPTTTGLSSAPIYVILSNLFSWMMGLFTTFAVLAFVISGIQYLTSAGDEDQIEKAKHNAKYALIGIVIGLSGFIIVQAIAAALSGQGYFF